MFEPTAMETVSAGGWYLAFQHFQLWGETGSGLSFRLPLFLTVLKVKESSQTFAMSCALLSRYIKYRSRNVEGIKMLKDVQGR
jgi:hypothetical protein